MPRRCANCPPNGGCEDCKRKDREARARQRRGRRRSAVEERASSSPSDVMSTEQAREVAVEIIRLAVVRYPPSRDPWLLPDDRIRDEVAVTLASQGYRRVRLTYLERVEAATEIIKRGGTLKLVCKRLSLPVTVTEAEWVRESPAKTVRKLLGYGHLCISPAAWTYCIREVVKRSG